MKKLILLLACLGLLQRVPAQSKTKTDSVIINVGEASKVIFAIGNKKDLETLKQYDFQAVVNDLVAKLQNNDSTTHDKPAEEYVQSQPTEQSTTETSEDWDTSWRERDRDRGNTDWDNGTDRQVVKRERGYYGRRTYHSFNFDVGTNNYLSDKKFPDQNNELYTVRPWGSWYIGLNSTQRTRVARTFFLEWGLGVSWYNWKFQNEKVLIGKDGAGITFTEDPRDYNFKKSKLTATFLNASIVPMLDLGGNRRKAMFFDGDHSESFRIGVGPYAGYRIDSYSRLVYKKDGDKEEDKDRDNYYLNNIRYGVRLQVGFRDTDLFLNYDLNKLFATDKGPQLNAFSFGITF